MVFKANLRVSSMDRRAATDISAAETQTGIGPLLKSSSYIVKLGSTNERLMGTFWAYDYMTP